MGTALLRFGAMALAVLAAGCAGSVRQIDGGFRHQRHGYTIAAPGGAWQAVEVDQATLAFKRGDAESMTLKSRCGRPVARAELMARHLLIGLTPRDVVESHSVSVDGRSGWLQVVDTAFDGKPVRLKTVTLVVGDCSFDWVIATSADPIAAEAEFDAWWQSFRADTSHHGDADT